MPDFLFQTVGILTISPFFGPLDKCPWSYENRE